MNYLFCFSTVVNHSVYVGGSGEYTERITRVSRVDFLLYFSEVVRLSELGLVLLIHAAWLWVRLGPSWPMLGAVADLRAAALGAVAGWRAAAVSGECFSSPSPFPDNVYSYCQILLR